MTASAAMVLEQAEALLASGKSNEAASLCRRLITQYPKNARAQSLLGTCEMAQGNFSAALTAYMQATALNPSDLDAHNRTGAIHLALGDVSAAIASFRAAIANGPKSPDGYNNLGTLLAQMGQFKEAEGAYARAIELAPKAAETHSNMGGLLERQGRIEDANASFGRAVELDRNHLRARVGRVRMFQCMQDLDGWRKSIAACAGLGPWPARILGELMLNEALAMLLSGDLTACAAVAERMTELPREPQPNITDLTTWAYSQYLRDLVRYRQSKPAPSVEGLPPLPMVGDSHCLSPMDTKVVLDGNPYRLRPHLAIGCKAWHLSASVTGRLRMGFEFALQAAIDTLPDQPEQPSPIIIAFGEIDCRVDEGIYRHHTKRGTDPLPAVGPLVEGYVGYVANAIERMRGTKQLAPMLYGVPAPRASRLNLIGVQRQIFLEIVRRFNRELGRQAAARGMRLIDVYSATDSGDGTADGRYHLDDKHLKPEVLSHVLELSRLGEVFHPAEKTQG